MTKKLSRRDAIKLLGAATGATLLANLPSKWSKPSLASGVLPAHAQTSLAFDLVCGAPLSINIFSNSGTVNAGASIVPASDGVALIYSIAVAPTQGTAGVTSPISLIGTLFTTGGAVTLPVTVQALTFNGLISTGVVNITWAIPKSGISCIQQINYVFSVIP
jgi:hypothetical protein